MKTEWKECQRGDGPRGKWQATYVTLNPKGSLVMNGGTYKRLGEPSAVILMFDGANNRIGVKPTARGVRNSFPVGVQGKLGGRRIHAYRLMLEFGIIVKQTLIFPDAEIDREGILVLDLRSAEISPRSIGYHRSRQRRLAGDTNPDPRLRGT